MVSAAHAVTFVQPISERTRIFDLRSLVASISHILILERTQHTVLVFLGGNNLAIDFQCLTNAQIDQEVGFSGTG